MKKSFTLLEILVAAAIFAVVALVSLATISSVMKPKAKTHMMQSLQESAWRAMETMVEQIKRANENSPSPIYQRFALTNEFGVPLQDPDGDNKIISHRLNAIYKVVQAGTGNYNTVVRAFGVYQNGTFQEDECDPQIGRCILKMGIRIVRGDFPFSTTINFEDISTPDIDVLSVNFEGYHWPGNDIFPWVEIVMEAQSRYQGQPIEAGKIIIKTKVSPSYNIGWRNVQ